MKQYKLADEPRKIANETAIPKWHEHLSELTISYLFTDDLGEVRGRVALAKTKKASAIEAFLGACDVLIVFDEKIWARLSSAQHLALVDHELCHVKVNAKGAPVIVGHDLEEFSEVVRRHGAWRSDVVVFGEALAQGRFDFAAAALKASSDGPEATIQ